MIKLLNMMGINLPITCRMVKHWLSNNQCLFTGHDWQYGEGWEPLTKDGNNTVYVTDYRCTKCLKYKDSNLNKQIYRDDI